MILFIHRNKETNIGDLSCCPADYFPFPSYVKIDIKDVWDHPLKNYKVIIIGGGGLFYFSDEIKYVLQTKLPVIGWGIGTNNHDCTLDYGSIDLNDFALLGLRDKTNNRYVPCVSCMSTLFKKDYKIEHDLVIYEHRDKPIDFNFPKLNNDAKSLEQVINHIGSASCILTNSYHGLYWAKLLGRSVILWQPFSSRFLFTPWEITIANFSQEIKKTDKLENPILIKSIAANKSFYSDVSLFIRNQCNFCI